MAWYLAFVALSAFALVSSVMGHGGGLHDWTFLPEPSPGREFIRHQVASCSSFAPVPVSANLGPLPAFPSPASSIQVVSGSASIFYYLDGNCTDRATTSIDMDVNITLNGQPYAGRQVNGYGFIGNCSNPNDLYRHNASRGDDRFNMVWFKKENSNTTEDGNLFGAAPNVFISRVPPAADALRSLVLYPSPEDSVPICCDLVYNPPPPADFFTQGTFCRTPAPPPPSPPSPPNSPPPATRRASPPPRRTPPRKQLPK
ncbi:hypothetical protein CHLRE_07g346900v5 [Chlamydomonas reinhardtii]|uniref:Pherophorin domain-containing protein n=1 Tax=Chlamydomonas reinhardtii TaxID=3055 RepID=A0A2K3DL05_CHLRE|nr:uncharacterized protein CHLRE_07g346900v5 [Chlamydomonas reinhardtii]PNW81215.1 hypothetical protein CHLRE_07g346900v5 [Chlamydomonas reinhardtii]